MPPSRFYLIPSIGQSKFHRWSGSTDVIFSFKEERHTLLFPMKRKIYISRLFSVLPHLKYMLINVPSFEQLCFNREIFCILWYVVYAQVDRRPHVHNTEQYLYFAGRIVILKTNCTIEWTRHNHVHDMISWVTQVTSNLPLQRMCSSAEVFHNSTFCLILLTSYPIYVQQICACVLCPQKIFASGESNQHSNTGLARSS